MTELNEATAMLVKMARANDAYRCKYEKAQKPAPKESKESSK